MGLETKYLEECVKKLERSIAELNDLEEHDSEAEQQKMADVLQELLRFEMELREKCEIGARFNVIHSQLQSLITTYTKELGSKITKEPAQSSTQSKETPSDEEIVYVHLFNTQGARLSSWIQLLSSAALMDVSVNRPIYAKKEHVEELLRSKSDIDLHAYLKVRIKKDDILMPISESVLKDSVGNLLLRLKYGALRQDNILEFHHKGKVYLFSKEEGLVLK